MGKYLKISLLILVVIGLMTVSVGLSAQTVDYSASVQDPGVSGNAHDDYGAIYGDTL